jgi:hypothetical protein
VQLCSGERDSGRLEARQSLIPKILLFLLLSAQSNKKHNIASNCFRQ